jgi:two-component system NtrC family response regulator
MQTELVGFRGGLAGVLPLVHLAAQSGANVLIHGETGTGKELIAQSIHRQSTRGSGPFVVANCAAIPHELLESELFGHVRGAYTGAIREHEGYFAAARHGTLLLDEIGDLHPDLQAKMLHVVEGGHYHKVGSTRDERHDARLISATNRSLPELIQRGRFRPDLFYRINVLTVVVPPLRERREDILELARRFLGEACRRSHRIPPEFDEAVRCRLRDHPWPGNVRELRNCMERVALLSRGTVLRARDIDRALDSVDAGAGAATNPVRPLAEVERDAIEGALRHFRGNRTRAAAALGISRRTLQSRLKLYSGPS